MDTYVPLRLSITLTLMFVGSLALHILAIYLYHRVAIFKRFTPSFLSFGKNAIPLKPVMTIADQHKDQLKEHATKLGKTMAVLTEKQLANFNRRTQSQPPSRRHSFASGQSMSKSELDQCGDELRVELQPDTINESSI